MYLIKGEKIKRIKGKKKNYVKMKKDVKLAELKLQLSLGTGQIVKLIKVCLNESENRKYLDPFFLTLRKVFNGCC